ncbi:hypothetical protein [Sphingobacterium detergens]|uniref:Uncharacterized protein n=1 Tax=Sphingobacterium detergens TaxID=1145106 RepID=A0A420AIZ7_SPHD1|nr:hypothetical protein [Sphingobacterium detergens]RKE44312.1 hypothetical protein DFQ12_4779 [Sphingobacterium detergens]
MKIIKYINYWTEDKKIKSEKATVGKWDIWNKTKYKSKVEKGELTSEQVARDNHPKGFAYEFCAFEREGDEIPFALVNLVLRSNHAGVDFIDPAGRNYLSYLFGESKRSPEELFLREVWYYNFPTENTEEEDYRMHFVFDEEGNVNYRKYDEVNKKTLDYESNRQFNMTGLYEPIPTFGDYESLIRLERDLPIDVMI